MAREPDSITDLRRDLGGRLAVFRVAAGLTQANLAHRMYVDRSMIAHLERGRGNATAQWWAKADTQVNAGGVLVARYEQLESARAAREAETRRVALDQARTQANTWRANPPVAPHPESEQSTFREPATNMDRRDLLRLLGVAAAPSWLGPLNADDHERLAQATLTPRRVDERVLEHIESLLVGSKATDAQLGPEVALYTARAQTHLLRAMIDQCPDSLRPRLLSTLGHGLAICGWLTFNTGDNHGAERFYEQARTFAHEARDPDLAAFTLANHALLAIWSKRPRTAVDHSLAADYWASRTDNAPLKAFIADMSAMSLAAADNPADSLRKLDTTPRHLDALPNAAPSHFYYYSDAIHTSRRGQTLLTLGRTSEAIPIITRSLGLYETLKRTDPTQLGIKRNIIASELELSKAHAINRDVDESVRVVSAAIPRITENPTPRMGERLQDILDHLQPWANTPAIRELTDSLRHQKLITH
ncbi:helix-turn-helix transcriptional regulator [Actinokineospora sp. NBRC 105648]|uniref:helix-turn-helix domain-containing protein n=1 Tax=Actinokineospora sp. NBRC 105648 TaxID=3032206 RepID=UPI0024A4C53B|nr:helix-turn-helix transcriptional regulator [Actinokineospora sp. NBRC 105648]GLZ42884.1 hypothetical protein Acsp05_65080 [Actinokineospora sp. NBRC 105648]